LTQPRRRPDPSRNTGWADWSPTPAISTVGGCEDNLINRRL
jgi:hypothetical protein